MQTATPWRHATGACGSIAVVTGLSLLLLACGSTSDVMKSAMVGPTGPTAPSTFTLAIDVQLPATTGSAAISGMDDCPSPTAKCSTSNPSGTAKGISPDGARNSVPSGSVGLYGGAGTCLNSNGAITFDKSLINSLSANIECVTEVRNGIAVSENLFNRMIAGIEYPYYPQIKREMVNLIFPNDKVSQFSNCGGNPITCAPIILVLWRCGDDNKPDNDLRSCTNAKHVPDEAAKQAQIAAYAQADLALSLAEQIYPGH